ncbi:MAG: endonuclease III [Acidobacteria bacterium]|uniref:Endonuclease III n=1 Tax=Candidatus Polarisedimenticola svalbardensis TaxID=2886004 RepID=A0A8J7CKC9_9BACT|nr:endonuclease III [Candidatus Polarisedimenticola svalbardensis]
MAPSAAAGLAQGTEDRSLKRGREIVRGLEKLYPDAECALHHSSPLQLLMATILSAQCTDERVNLVTPDLFRKYPDAAALADADPAALEQLIHSTGFFRNKARSLIAMATSLTKLHAGEVPDTMEALVELAGVGRKTANVILGTCFGRPAITVDTHVKRLSGRLGLTNHTDPVKIERDLMKVLPEEDWTLTSHRLIWHGRRICKARKPACIECGIASLCPSNGSF